MSKPGTDSNPLRVAIIGAGPTGFYAAEHLLKRDDLIIEVDMFDRLPTPYGLVRLGVAPDHQKIKSVTKVFDKTASSPKFRFFGYVEFGQDIMLEDLQTHYHQIIFATGTQSDRKLGIPGEDLPGSYPATEFVAWYNGHPDYRDFTFDLSRERVAVIGVGNVAMDVARILSRTPAELAKTDIADYALEALSQSNIKEVTILGRRGPAQAAFTNPEIKELGEMEDAAIFVPAEEAALDPQSQKWLNENPDKTTLKKLEIIQSYTTGLAAGKSKRINLRFLVSPVEVIGNETDGIRAVRLVKNELYATAAGTLRPRVTNHFEELPVELIFRSVGYQGSALPGVPFNDNWGVILNQKGRILNPDTENPIAGLYTAGWIKRGPSGVIGTNKPDALETVSCMIKDLGDGSITNPAKPDPAAIERLVRERQPQFFSFADWQKLDEIEVTNGQKLGRPRVKFTCVEDMLAALGRK